MNILMTTNTYKPLVGGLEKSVEAFSQEFRKAGHRVVIVAPYDPKAKSEKDVIRIPAVQNFNGSDFSLQLPIPGVLTEALGDFKPDIVHTHHPFLIGDTALRLASKYNVPLVFTHHTLYEENVHYVPGNEEALKRFVIELSTGYANLADLVIAPSQSVRQLIIERGVETPVEVVPTGIYPEAFNSGGQKALRKKFKIPDDAFVLGHIGRLAPEKNLEFLCQAAMQFLKREPSAHMLIGGKGPSEEKILEIFKSEGLEGRLHMPGILKGKDLSNAYKAMDVFIFASQSETQGIVLTEAMAAEIPVVAVDAPGVRDIVEDGLNGRLLLKEDAYEFAEALMWMKGLPKEQINRMKTHCRSCAQEMSMEKSAERLLNLYRRLLIKGFVRRPSEESPWASTLRLVQAQWELVKNLTKATGAMMFDNQQPAVANAS